MPNGLIRDYLLPPGAVLGALAGHADGDVIGTQDQKPLSARQLRFTLRRCQHQRVTVRLHQGPLLIIALSDRVQDWVAVPDGLSFHAALAATVAVACRQEEGDLGALPPTRPAVALCEVYQHAVRRDRLCSPFMDLGAPRTLAPLLAPGADAAAVARLRDRAAGVVLCGAVGDALGRQVESRTVADRQPVTWYTPWSGWRGGPIGTITDDTQMTWWLAESLLANGGLVPEDVARRFVSHRIRGIGKATKEFVRRFKDEQLPWDQAGVASAGNGAAMRAAPVGVYLRDDFDALKLAAGMQAFVTHNDRMAIASSIVVAYAVARLLRMQARELQATGDKVAFCRDLAATIDGLEVGGGYRDRKDGQPASLAERIGQRLPSYLEQGCPPAEVERELWSGAYVLESLPLALYCFLWSPDHFPGVLYEAVNHSRDADTVAAMACSFCGALNGLEGCVGEGHLDRPRTGSDQDAYASMRAGHCYLEELEFRTELADLGRRLAGV